MTTESINLELEPRVVLGKKVKQLRRAGTVPVHLYGPGIEPRPPAVRAETAFEGPGPGGQHQPRKPDGQGRIR